jgi:hypothetical protein
MKKSLLFSRSFASMLFVLINSVLNGQIVVFSEDFSGFTTGTHIAPSTVDLSANLDSKTLLPGWKGSKVYSAGGEIKLGTSEITGWIETPSIDFSGFTGPLLLRFSMSCWTGDAASVQVTLNGSPLGPAIVPTDDFKVIEIQISDGILSGKIKFESLSKRFFLDNVVVLAPNTTSAWINGSDPAGIIIYPNPVEDFMTICNAENFRRIEISDISGRVHKTMEISFSKKSELLVNDLPTGIYFVRFLSVDGIKTLRIIKK